MQTLSHGNTYQILMNIKNSDGSVKDLSGTLELKYALALRKDTTPLVQYSLSDAELAITNASQGVVTLTLSNTVLNTLPERQYYHELWQINALGDPTTLMGESLYISEKLIKE